MSATLVGGVVTGMIVGDSLGAMGQSYMPAAQASAVPQTAAPTRRDGSPAAPAPTARDTLHLSAFFVIGALVFLIFGSRALKGARVA